MIVLALLLAASAAPDLGAEAPRGPHLEGRALDARTNEIGALLRCPVCQGLSVTDSPATMARNMKAEVREKLKAGYDQEQILASFERSYGEFVRLEPPVRGVNWLVWLGPIAVLVIGGAVIAWSMRRPEKVAQPSAEIPSRDALPDDADLAAAVRRVRAMAYGWPDGLSPKATP
jgi:cytochrome c-type biogenesis protein CcmH